MKTDLLLPDPATEQQLRDAHDLAHRLHLEIHRKYDDEYDDRVVVAALGLLTAVYKRQ